MHTGRQEYWLHKDSKDVCSHLEDYHTKWSVWDNSPFRQAWVRNIIAYYSPVISPASWDTSLIFEGIQGELVRFYTPKARVLVRQMVGLITKQRLAAQCIADDSVGDIIKFMRIANALLPQIIDECRIDVKANQVVEGSLVAGMWFWKACWRTDKGKPYTQSDDGSIIYTGGVDISTHSPFDVYYNVSYVDWKENPWAEVRVIRNRWDLIAQHPDLEREIKALPSVNEVRGPNVWFDRSTVNEDSVYCYEMYARPTPALPEGRLLIYGDNRCVFHDGPNDYGDIPIEPLCPEPVMMSGVGYPAFSNILAAQEMLDNSLSAIATNQSQFAVQSVAIPRGGNINVQELNGMRFVSFTPQNVPGGGMPQPLQLTQTAPETFKFVNLLEETMTDLWGIPGALRGQPPPGVTSGTAIATLTANALEFNEPMSKAHILALEKILHHAVNCYIKFGKLEQNVQLEGKNNQVSNLSFTGEDLRGVKGVKIVTTNPLMQTIAGRIEVSEKLLQMPKEIWPKYVSILEGRPLQDLYKNDLSEEDLIHSENEMMMNGKPAPALITDCHGLHVQEHRGLLNDPNVRMNGQFIQVIMEHIQEHLSLARQEDPLMRAMIETGRMPEMPPQGGPPPGPGPGGPPMPGGMPHHPPHVPGPEQPADAQMHTANPAKDVLNRPIALPQQKAGTA